MREIGPYRVLRAPGGGCDGGAGGGADGIVGGVAGGAGRLHLCRAADGLLVVVEELHPAQAPDAAARRRFARQARDARRLDGSWTVPVLDADPDAERPWLATAYTPAPDLAELLRTTGPLPVATVRRLGAGLARALAAGHAVGLVHAGLEPARVLVTASGPRLTGFGLPPVPGPDGATGALGYASPEQLERPAETGPPSDVFALGALLATAAQGRHPWTGHSWAAPSWAAPSWAAPSWAGHPQVGSSRPGDDRPGHGPGTEDARAVRRRTTDGRPDLADVPGEVLPALARCLDPDPALRPTPHQLLVLLDAETVDAVEAAEAEAVDGPGPGGSGPDGRAESWLPPAGLALVARYAADLPSAREAGPVHLHPLIDRRPPG
ncbi:hypothetical protein HUT16_00310 [Kitasatospora sp. NA04385]|uniref:protein kinase domain-containing protein n=1 Tax=Kitasatospora sp. NA04385 TaxID=2742135 RepID=UPI00158FD7B7|nr:hypothetical protein [Kitasatospora sp. NA04385]QKW17708.1 hypothetical protein HUT16_00310 [Kitasatospora sp. NA04385]